MDQEENVERLNQSLNCNNSLNNSHIWFASQKTNEKNNYAVIDKLIPCMLKHTLKNHELMQLCWVSLSSHICES